MPDIITNTPTPSPTPAPKTKRARGEVNREYLDELANARAVATAAADPARIAGLTAVEFDATLPGQINALAAITEGLIGKVTGLRAGKKAITAQESAARDALIAVIAPIQTAAKRKFAGGDQRLRDAYYIGNGLPNETLEEVLNAARSIHARLIPGANNAPPQDVLPGVQPGVQIKDLADAIALYGGKNQAQSDQQQAAAGMLETIAAQISILAGFRHSVQLAADQAWPWRNEGVTTLRKAFLLPVDRPLKD